uniref:E4 protein n=1 Tax=Human papillomavirus TaxID=10566 RepID=A0A385PR77_9PAPI|nr:MAG: E4 protein [Human papillomavirus]
MNNFPPLLPALLGGIYPTSPTKTDLLRRAPGTPAIHRRSLPLTEEERNRTRRKALALPAGHQRDDDDDEESNKENIPPPDQRKEQEEETLHQILTKLEEIIDQFLSRVSADLQDFRQKLGTRRSS